MGKLYYYGICVTRDIDEAVKWAEKAARNNDLEAQELLSLIDSYGTDIQENAGEVTDWP